jgi:TonB-dependent starch-binding outer membrane protein SusC
VMGVTPSLIVGGTASPMNAGSVNNKGLELELNWRDRIGNDFSYSIRTNIATLKNKVTYLDKSIAYITGATMSNNPITIFEQGSEIWHFYGYQFTGINPKTGEATFKDINGDGSITSADCTNLGSAIPKYNYGVTLTASYKGFDVLAFGSGSQGNKIYQCLVRTDRLTGNRLYDEFYENRWTSTNTTGTKPGATTDISKYLISSAMVKDGSFFKIKQIQFGYTVPAPLLKSIQISNLRVYISLDDFFTFTKYTGFDPEACSAGTGSSQGVDKGTYPVSKKFVAGINLTF